MRATMASNQLVSFDVDEVTIPFALGKRATYKVHITSLAPTTTIAYKVQTTSPKKFGVKPHTGILKPLATTTFVIILKPQQELPEDFPISRDKFLVTVMILPPDDIDHSPPPSLPTLSDWFTTKRHKITIAAKLRVVYIGGEILRLSAAKGSRESIHEVWQFSIIHFGKVLRRCAKQKSTPLI